MKTLTLRQQINRVTKWYNIATQQEINAGLVWYNDAQQLCIELATKYQVTTTQIAQVISVLSPQKKWETNKLETIAFCNEFFNGVKPSFNYFATKKSIEECKQILKGDFLIPSKRTKTFSFADNIANTQSKEITIDRHALRIAYDDKSAKIDKVTPKQYKIAREAYQIVADSLGITGYQLQAITWVTYKRVVNR